MGIRGSRTRIGALLVAAAVAGAALIGGPGVVAAGAVPGDPGEPADPTVVFTEDFQNPAGSSYQTTWFLTGNPNPNAVYSSASGLRYDADPVWDSGRACNGVMLSAAITNLSGQACLDGVNIGTAFDRQKAGRQMASALAQINGTGYPNRAMAGFTNTAVPAGGAVMRTVDRIPVPVSARFFVFSMSAAATSCGIAQPGLVLAAVDEAGNEVALNSAPIDPCTDSRSTQLLATTIINTGPVLGGSFMSDRSMLLDGTSIGLVLRDTVGASGAKGNDFMVDDLRVLDATPSLDQSLSPIGAIGRGAELTFTVTNTSELAEKAGWSFTDALPQGMQVASPAAASSTCAATTITAGEGSASVAATGTLPAGTASCTITVQVTADAPGDYASAPADFTVHGLEKPGAASILFTDPRIAVETHAGAPGDVNGDGLTDAGDTIAYSYTVTNPGDVPLTGVTVTDAKVGPIACPSAPLAPGASFECTADAVYTVTEQDVIDGAVATSAVASGDTPATGPVSSPASTSSTPTTAPRPALALTQSADPAGPAALRAGDPVTFSFKVTNTGNVPLASIAAVEGSFSGSAPFPQPDCGTAKLPVGDSLVCTADYVFTQDDIEAGRIASTATATATGVGGSTTAMSDPSTAEVEITSAPALALEVRPDPAKATKAGQRVAYELVVTNTGNRIVHGVAVEVANFSGAGTPPVGCQNLASVLAPGESATCTAEYTVVAGDLTGRPIRLSAEAGGTVDGAAVESQEAAGSLETVNPDSGGSGNGSGRAASAKGGLAVTGAEPLSIAVPAAAALLALGGLALTMRRRRATR